MLIYNFITENIFYLLLYIKFVQYILHFTIIYSFIELQLFILLIFLYINSSYKIVTISQSYVCDI